MILNKTINETLFFILIENVRLVDFHFADGIEPQCPRKRVLKALEYLLNSLIIFAVSWIAFIYSQID